jgi:hypothetical protein
MRGSRAVWCRSWPMLEEFVRPLSERDRRFLKGHLSRERSGLKAGPVQCLTCSVIVLGVAVLAVVLGNPPRSVLVLTVAAYLLIILWVHWSVRRERLVKIRRLERALDRNEAHVVHIQSDEMVEFEEIEDEGASYAFQVSDDRIVFVCGQDFYASARFPNSDFSMVWIRDERGELLDFYIEKHGVKLKPIRTISAQRKRELRVLGRLETIQGKLSDLERLLTE